MVLVCRAPLPVAQLGLVDRRHEREVVADRTALEPPPPEPQGFDRDARDPQRGVQMARAAADDDVPARPAGAAPEADGFGEGEDGRDREAALALRRRRFLSYPITLPELITH